MRWHILALRDKTYLKTHELLFLFFHSTELAGITSAFIVKDCIFTQCCCWLWILILDWLLFIHKLLSNYIEVVKAGTLWPYLNAFVLIIISVPGRRQPSPPSWFLLLQVEPRTVWQPMTDSNIKTAGLLLQLLVYFAALYYGYQW